MDTENVELSKVVYDCFQQALDLPDAERLAFLANLGMPNAHSVRELVLRRLEQHRHLVESGRLDSASVHRFELQTGLGSGAFGRVFSAFDKRLNRTIAIKLLDPGTADHYLREAQIAAKLNHPNIAQIFDTGVMSGQPFICQELVDGCYLSEMNLPIPRLIEIFRKVASALAYAHQRGIVHRDLKPANILIDALDEPKLVDFGCAAEISNHTSDAIEGTPRYIAPEQILGKVATPAADIYAFGVILYELLVGQPPFDGSAKEVMEGHQTLKIASLRTLRADVPLELEAMCVKCLHKCPEDRYRDGQELVAEFDRVRSGLRPKALRGVYVSPRLRRACARLTLIAVPMAILVHASWPTLRLWSNQARDTVEINVDFARQGWNSLWSDTPHDPRTASPQSNAKQVLARERELYEHYRQRFEASQAMAEKDESDPIITFGTFSPELPEGLMSDELRRWREEQRRYPPSNSIEK